MHAVAYRFPFAQIFHKSRTTFSKEKKKKKEATVKNQFLERM